MTAEIAIFNRNGVALAADSAVTTGPSKVFTSAEKLFQLSHVDPVAIMICGNASFLDMPWETIIKTYRQQHGEHHQATIAEHAEHFLHYIENNAALFSPLAQRNFVTRFAMSIIIAMMNGGRERARHIEAATPQDRLAAVVNGFIAELDAALVSLPQMPPAVAVTVDELATPTDEAAPWITSAVEQLIAADLRELLPIDRLASLISQSLPKAIFPSRSEIVVAGFGTTQYLPAVHAWTVDGMFAGRLRHVKTKDVVIGDESDSGLIPFAQTEMVELFMGGIDPGISELVDDAFSRLPPGDPGPQRVRDRCEGFKKPVLDNIAALPKDELAAMAEAFVNLTKFRRRVSTDLETVGGPIDCAVITKGDGFVWIKRKHYFDPALNPRVMARYSRGEPA